jgi:hypothetical protein
MNICRKFLSAAGFLGLLCLLLPSSARADTIYTYNSNLLSDNTTLTITLDFLTPLPSSLNFVDESSSASLASWSMVDSGGFTLSSTIGSYLSQLSLSTDLVGNITAPWDAAAVDLGTGNYIVSADDPGSDVGVKDFYVVGTSQASISGDPGTWTSIATPEPGTFTLLFVGLLGLGLLAGVKRYRGHRLQTQA